MVGPTKLTLRVSPGARRGAVVGRQLAVPRRDVEIVSGHGGRDKIVALAGIGPDELERRLASATVGKGKERE